MIKVKYIGTEHTFAKVWNEKKKILNWEIIEIPEESKKFFLSNSFEQVWWKSKEEILEWIEKIERETNNDRSNLEREIKAIETRLFKEISELENNFEVKEKMRQERISKLNEQLENVEDDYTETKKSKKSKK